MSIYSKKDSDSVREATRAFVKANGVLRTVAAIYIGTSTGLRTIWEAVSSHFAWFRSDGWFRSDPW